MNVFSNSNIQIYFHFQGGEGMEASAGWTFVRKPLPHIGSLPAETARISFSRRSKVGLFSRRIRCANFCYDRFVPLHQLYQCGKFNKVVVSYNEHKHSQYNQQLQLQLQRQGLLLFVLLATAKLLIATWQHQLAPLRVIIIAIIAIIASPIVKRKRLVVH